MDRYVFADEAGNFDFSATGTRYFVLTTVAMDDFGAGDRLLALRREMAWEGTHLDRVFHATQDPQAVRDRVFAALATESFRVDATILEKRKTQPHLQSEAAFYKMAWWLHFKHVAPKVARRADRLFVAAAELGTKKKRGAFKAGLDAVVFQVSPCASHRVAFWPVHSEPCLQVADYAAWAIQRKWEGRDSRSHVLIKSKIKTEFDVWSVGKTFYY